MKWMVPLILLAFAVLVPRGSAAGGPSDERGKPSLVVCYTAGSVNVREARKATDSMLRVLETIGGWPSGHFESHFTARLKECERFLKDKKPHYLFPSLGFFLEHRGKKRLVPLAQPRVNGGSTDIWRILVRKGTYRSMEELKGKTLGGTLCNEPRFLGKVVLRDGCDPTTHFKLKPSKRALRPLRNLASGRLDAVLINDQQFRALDSLPFSKDLEPVFTSGPLPLPGLFADTTLTSEKERNRFGKAMIAFCKHPDGKSFCELFGIESFTEVKSSAFDEVQKLWDK